MSTTDDTSHDWHTSTFTHTTTCTRCGLLPLDPDDYATTCPDAPDAEPEVVHLTTTGYTAGVRYCGADRTEGRSVHYTHAPRSWATDRPAGACPECFRVCFPLTQNDYYRNAVEEGAARAAVTPDVADITAAMRAELGPYADGAGVEVRRPSAVGASGVVVVYGLGRDYHGTSKTYTTTR